MFNDDDDGGEDVVHPPVLHFSHLSEFEISINHMTELRTEDISRPENSWSAGSSVFAPSFAEMIFSKNNIYFR